MEISRSVRLVAIYMPVPVVSGRRNTGSKRQGTGERAPSLTKA